MKVGIININNFSGGISDDVRERTDGVFHLSKHFDIFTEHGALTPYRSFEADEGVDGTNTSLTAFDIENFLYANSKLYGCGHVSGAGTKLFEKAVTEIATGNWTISATASGSAGVPKQPCFTHYKDYLYGFQGGSYVWRYGDITGTKSFDNTWKTLSHTNIAEGWTGKDDKLYLPYDNNIASWDDTTWDATALVLPTRYQITRITNWGTKAAIACKPNNLSENSKVYTWDLVSDDVSDVIDWGEGSLEVLANIEGTLFGVSNLAGNIMDKKPRMIIRYWNGGEVRILKEIPLLDSAGNDYRVLQRQRQLDSKLYFIVDKVTSGTEFAGIWVIGRKISKDPFAVTLDQRLAGVGNIQNFFKIRDYTFIAHSGDGSVEKTDDIANYNDTSTCVTQKYDGGDYVSDKEFRNIKVGFEPLPANAKVTAEYRINSTSTWTLLDSISTTNATELEIGQESSGGNLGYFKEVQFKLTSYKNAVITSFKAPYNILD